MTSKKPGILAAATLALFPAVASASDFSQTGTPIRDSANRYVERYDINDAKARWEWMPDDKGKKLGPAYWLAGAAVLGTNIYDVENTLRCIDSGTCREGNAPMIPFMKNRLAAYGVSLPLYAVAMYGAAEFKRSDSKKVRRLWPLPLIVVGAGHILLGLDANRY